MFFVLQKMADPVAKLQLLQQLKLADMLKQVKALLYVYNCALMFQMVNVIDSPCLVVWCCGER